MNSTQHTQIDYEEFLPMLIEFEELCNDRFALEINGLSNFYTLVESVLEIVGKNKKHIRSEPQKDIREPIIKAFGLIDLINKILNAKEHESFDELSEHIKLFSSNAGIIQNYISSIRDSKTNKIFELYVAAACLNFADNIELDDPIHSSGGENPDIIFELDNQRFGIACKVLHSNKFKSYLANVKKGVEQLERSAIDHGFVLLNMKNIIDYEHFWPILACDVRDRSLYIGAYSTINMPIRFFNNCNHQYFENLGALFNSQSDKKDLFSEDKVMPISINYFNGVCGILDSNNNVRTTFVRRLYSIPYLEFEFDGIKRKMINLLDKSLGDLPAT